MTQTLQKTPSTSINVMSKLTETPKISSNDPVIAEVWNLCGARCAFHGCNEYLLQDELTKNSARLAQVAHIVARSPNGPRGDNPLPFEERNNIQNLMLACPKHHLVIDNKKLAEQYPVSLLMDYKHKHESRIKYLTGLSEDFGTTVLRVLGTIRGNGVSVTHEEVRSAVINDGGLYPEYIGDENDIEINLQGLPNEVDEGYWNAGLKVINEKINSLIEPRLERGEIKQISVFALTRIPLLVYLGSKLSNKARVHLHQLQSTDPQGWVWHEKPSHAFVFETLQGGSDESKVALVLQLSGGIGNEMLPENIDSTYTIYSIKPADVEPSRDLFTSKGTLLNFRDEYQKVLRFIEAKHSGAKLLDMFLAAPAPASIVCGQEILRDVTPDILVYDRIGEDYKPTIKINNHD
jgi:hypothetical protein